MRTTPKRLAARPIRRYSQSTPFVDRVKVLLASGSGGDGASIMGHLMNNEFAGPMGGNGGKGGDLFVCSSKNLQDLSHIAGMGSQLVAEKGSIGFGDLSGGKKGRSLEVMVPLGTQIVDVDSNQVVVDLDESDMKVLLLEGGQGGKGNANFATSAVHSPKEATRGLPGNTMLANIELKLIADCGLVGYPNAGKSSLLNAISTSRPQIAAYPFTTLNPYVGVVHDLYGQSCSIADLPGLIEGAFENRGLGHQFLRHVERTTVIAFVIDMYSPFVPTDTSISSSLAAMASAEASQYQPVGQAHEDCGPDECGHSHDGHEQNHLRETLTSTSMFEQNIAKKDLDNPFITDTKVRMQEPWEVLETLQNELEFYLPGLSDKGLIVFANKMDLEKDSAGNSMQKKLEEFRRRTSLPVFPISAMRGIEYGAHHPSTGLSEALNLITRNVYATKKAREEANQNSKRNLDDQMDEVYRGRNIAHFTPVDFSTWRAQIKSPTGGFASFGGGHALSEPDAYAQSTEVPQAIDPSLSARSSEFLSDDISHVGLGGDRGLDDPMTEESDYYFNDMDPLSEHKLARGGGLTGVAASSDDQGFGGFATNNGHDNENKPAVSDIEAEIAAMEEELVGKLVPEDHFGIGNSRLTTEMLRHQQKKRALQKRQELIEAADSEEGSVNYAEPPSHIAKQASTLKQAKGFTLLRKPKVTTKPLPTAAENQVTSGQRGQRGVSYAFSTHQSSSAHQNMAQLLPKEEVMSVVRGLVGGETNESRHDPLALQSSDLHRQSLLPCSSPSRLKDILKSKGNPSSFSIAEPRSASPLRLQHQPLPSVQMFRTPNVNMSEMSLVDQQLDDVVGKSGYGDEFDAYKNRPARSKFSNYRDRSLRGQYWKLSREPGEKLRDEKWQ